MGLDIHVHLHLILNKDSPEDRLSMRLTIKGWWHWSNIVAIWSTHVLRHVEYLLFWYADT